MASISKYGNLIGKRFSRLTVVASAPKHKGGALQWVCRCDCGNTKVVTSSNLSKGLVRSCGCLQKEKAKVAMIKIEKGWLTTCAFCGKEFKTLSCKQIYCCDDCSFNARIKETSTGCMEWQGYLLNGYGTMSITVDGKRKMIRTHRYAWERVHGKIPDGLCVCHKCDNPKCVNIDHLFLGTKQDNNRDKAEKGRAFRRKYSEEERKAYSLMNRGENNKGAKLTEAQVIDILAMKGTATYAKIAEMYGVSRDCIKGIFTGMTWKHINRDT